MNLVKIILILLSLCFCGNIYAQNDTLLVVKKNPDIQTHKTRWKGKPNATKAALLSAALPGAGQFYNRKLWQLKIPLIYVGGFALGLLVRDTHIKYKEARNSYVYRHDNNPQTIQKAQYKTFSDQRLLERKSRHKRDRDFYMIMTLLWYAINVGDASSSAQHQLRKLQIKNATTYWQIGLSSKEYAPIGVAMRLRFE